MQNISTFFGREKIQDMYSCVGIQSHTPLQKRLILTQLWSFGAFEACIKSHIILSVIMHLRKEATFFNESSAYDLE